VTRKLRGEKSSMMIQDLTPSMERTLWGVANRPKGASYAKATGPSKAKPYKSHCLVTVNFAVWVCLFSGMAFVDTEDATYLYIDNQSRSDSPEQCILTVPSRRQTTQT
jgi:hypothetical protein